jgi:hypothetical protein
MALTGTFYLAGFIMLGNAGLSMLNCKRYQQ